MEHCIRGDGEEIRNFLDRIKRTVDKRWPDDLNGIEAAHHAAELEAQGRQRRQRYIDYSLKGLRPRYLQRKAQEYVLFGMTFLPEYYKEMYHSKSPPIF